jgi:tetratricopeptide (TPR) repeat protein
MQYIVAFSESWLKIFIISSFIHHITGGNIMSKRTLYLFSSLLLFAFVSQSLAQRPLPIFPRVSPQASVSQNIAAFVQIKIDYSRPGVNNREVWGQLVPYGLAPNAFGNGKPMPWRAGANENTTISFSHDVFVEGQEIKAGKYGLHMIPGENDVTIIFNKNSKAWGSFFYEPDLDALRVRVKWQEAPFQERLLYAFDYDTVNTTTAYLHWGTRKIPFKISVDTHKIVLETYRESLTTLPGFNPAAWAAAARYCLNNNINLDEAMAWADKALGMNGGATFNNKTVKAGLLTATGKVKEADELMAAAMPAASEAELNNYGYQLMNTNRLDEALKIFKMNLDQHPDSWNAHDSYGEALNNKGDKKGAEKYYEKALQMAPANQKTRIEGILKTL